MKKRFEALERYCDMLKKLYEEGWEIRTEGVIELSLYDSYIPDRNPTIDIVKSIDESSFIKGFLLLDKGRVESMHYDILTTSNEGSIRGEMEEVVSSVIDLPNNIKGVRYVYLMRNNSNGYHKIGCSKDPSFREKTLQAQEPDVELIWKKSGGFKEERLIQSFYSKKRLRGEWFDLSNDDVEKIKSLKW